MSFEVLVEVMSQAYDLGLTEKNRPHRAFISFQLNMGVSRESIVENLDLYRSPIAEPRPPTSVMLRAKKASRSLLLISLDTPRDTERFQKFKNELVKRTDHTPPFKNPFIHDLKTVSICCVIHEREILYLTLPYLTLPYFTSPCLTLPYPTLPYSTLPYPTLPHFTSHHFAMPCLTSLHFTLLYFTSLHFTSL